MSTGVVGASVPPRTRRNGSATKAPALAASGAPSIAVALSLSGALICRNSSYPQVRRFFPWVLGAGVLAVAVAFALTYHVTTFVPITLLGLYSLVKTGLKLKTATVAA